MSDLNFHFQTQREAFLKEGEFTLKQRKQLLRKLKRLILSNREDLKSAIHKDYAKHPTEVDLTEIFPTIHELKTALRNINNWVKPTRVGTPLPLLTTQSKIVPQAKGVALIISPWNFPINLTFIPLISAIAAGCRTIIKPSEMTPHTAEVMAKIINENFEPKEIVLINGGVETAKELLKLPFNHIFFTGSPRVGRLVMEAASKNLTSVTLELGGKSPTIIDESANVRTAAKGITWSKWLNNGQICISPDYVLVHESKKEELIAALQKRLIQLYGENIQKQNNYNRIVNEKHHERLKTWLNEAGVKGAKLHFGGEQEESENYFGPVVVSDLTPETQLAQEEIFGPILPIYSFTQLKDTISKIKENPPPLVLYIYSKHKKNIKQIIQNTQAGGTVVNQGLLHYFHPELPFGGINESGIGKSHGHFGFKEFSNERPVMKQKFGSGLAQLFMPPYTPFKQKMVNLLIRWF